MKVSDKICTPLRPLVHAGERWKNVFLARQPLVQGLSTSSSTSKASQDDESFFQYTSGRWLHDEQLQLERRYITFDIDALKNLAATKLGSRCSQIRKLLEGLYNKVFSLRMEDGREILARIPNPNAGPSRYVVASEVATLDFLRNILEIPVPEVIDWSISSEQPNPVGAEYILMEKVKGLQLSQV
ncbi:hypothetical protein VTN31DRAFT_176 [Thermomyces dupontii]|uniref:uncharacterized protein n=1 Tax=Talaromyces thermophilus TaxID=28565 RepID=UPI003742475B